MWINKKPVVIDRSARGTDGVFGYQTSLSDDYNMTPGEFHFNNIHFYEEKNGWSRHNIKFGHYREHQFEMNSIYFDDLKITEIFPDNRTKLKSDYCDILVPLDNKTLKIHEIPGATEYIAQFESDGQTNYVGMGNSTTLNLEYVNFLESGKTYNVRIRAKGVTNSGYGESCTITMPSKTKLKVGYCDIVVPFDNKNLKIYEIPGATEYVAQFESDGQTNYVGMGNSTTLNLDYVNFLEDNKTYTIRIRAKGVINDGYGESCTIRTNSIPDGDDPLAPNQKALSIKSISNHQKTIYPNPFNDIINLDFQNDIIHAQLYDKNGNSVLHITFKNSTSINLSELKTGIYFLKTTNKDNEITTYKLVKH